MVLVGLLLLAGTAGGALADELGGEAWLSSKSVEQGAVVIGAAVYRVGSETSLRGTKGEPLSLAGLPVDDYEALDDLPGRPAFWVRFDAARGGDGLRLQWLELVEAADDGSPASLPRAPGRR